MTADELRRSAAAPGGTQPPGLSGALLALWHDARGDWHKAHEAAQADTSAAAGQLFAHSTAIEAAAANTSQTLQRLYPPMDRPTPAGTAPAGAKV